MPDSGEELLGAATTGLGVAAMLKRVLLKADVDPAAGTLTIRPEEAVKWLRLTRYSLTDSPRMGLPGASHALQSATMASGHISTAPLQLVQLTV